MMAAEIKRIIRELQIKARRALTGTWGGFNKTSTIGRGLAFHDVRTYQANEDVRNIDWKVTARRGEPFIKTFTEEREKTIWLILDASPSMQFASGDISKLEYSVDGAAILAFWAQHHGDRVGLAILGPHPIQIAPQRGERRIVRLVGTMIEHVVQLRTRFTDSSLQSERGSKTTHDDPKGVIHRLARRRTGRGMVFAFSDFLGGGVLDALRPLAKRHEIHGLQIVDPWELELPKLGLVRFADATNGGSRVIDTDDEKFARLYTQNAKERNRRIECEMRRAGILPRRFVTSRPVLRAFRSHFAR